MLPKNIIRIAACVTLAAIVALGLSSIGQTAVVLKDRVMEVTTTTGTGSLSLGGALVGYQGFSTVGNGNQCYACAYAVNGSGQATGEWEVFLGTYTSSGSTLSRDTVLSSSNGGSAVNFSAGTKYVVLAVPASRHPVSGAPQQTGGTFSGTNSVFTVDGPLWADAGSGGENHLRGGWNNQNVVSVQHTADGNTFSAVRFLRHDGHEQGAVGVGNPGGGSTFAGAMYIESSEYTRNLAGGTYAPIPIKLVTTGYINGVSGIYLRQEIKGDGDTVLYDASAAAPNQKAAVTVSRLGNVVVGSAALATDATNGFLYIPTCNGTPTGTPTSYTGRAAMVLDSATGKFCVYSGGAWKTFTPD